MLALDGTTQGGCYRRQTASSLETRILHPYDKGFGMRAQSRGTPSQ